MIKKVEKEAKESNIWAVVRYGGHQFLVHPEEKVVMNRLEEAEKAVIRLPEVLLYADGGTIEVGQPLVAGVTVTAEVLTHEKADKVVVRRFKAKSRYRRNKGFRQSVSTIKILEIKKEAVSGT